MGTPRFEACLRYQVVNAQWSSGYGLLPIPAVAAVAGIAVMVVGEAILVALVATVAGTITGWLMGPVAYNVGERMDSRGVDWHRRSLGLVVYEYAEPISPSPRR